MADEKRQLILDLLARNKMRNDTNAAADDIDKLGRAAEDADEKTQGLGKSSEKTSKQTDKLGHSLSDTKSRIAGLDKDIEGIQRELAGLSASFADTNDAASRLDISKAIRKSENDLRRVTKNRSILSDLLPDPEPEVKRWGSKFSSALNDSVIGDLSSSSLLGTAGAVLGVTLAPMIGGVISAAVLGGVGAGGIIGGIALAASSSQQIKTWAGNIGSTFKAGVTAEARGAFEGPIMDSLGKVEVLAASAVPKIGKIFDQLAPSTFKLTDNLVRAGDAILDSLVNAAGKAGPVMGVLGNIIEDTGTNLGNFIDMAADHSDEAASALSDLNDALQNTIKVATYVVQGLDDIKGGLDSLDNGIDKARYSLEDHVSWLDLTADGYKKGSTAAQMYRDGLIGVAGSANDYDHYLAGAVDSTNTLAGAQSNAQKAAEGQRDALVGLSKELRAQTDPAFALLTAQDGVRDAQNAAADATKRYGANSEEARAASRKLADAALTLQGAAGAVAGSFDGKLSPSMRNTLKAAGLTKSQIAGVEAELKRAKAAADAYAGRYVAEIITNYTYNVGGADYNREKNRGNLGKRAAGGPVTRGVPYIVGENGPEIVVPDMNARVLSNSASRGVANHTGAGVGVATGSPGRSQTLQLEVVGSDARLVSLLKYLIRTANVLES
jgi:ABC-type transporter Mla subunit MlaD